MLEKILSLKAADVWVAGARSNHHTIGFSCGAFDLLHAGHVNLLERAKKLCDLLLVAVNSDESIRRYKNPLRPINPEAQRMQVVAGLGCVDAVMLMEDVRPLQLIERWHPDLYIKGGDYSAPGLRSQPAIESYGGKVVLLPFTTTQSTTAIIGRIAAIEAHQSLQLPPRTQPAKVAFLDRDGTLIRNVPYLHDPAKVELLPGVGVGLARLQEVGFRLVIVTNQQGLGLGYFPIEAFFETNQALFKALSPFKVKIDKVYFCPHSFADDCQCRKPGTALIEKALKDYGALAADCWMIGDNPSDVEAGRAAGCHALLVDENRYTPGNPSFSEAVNIILSSPDSTSSSAGDRATPLR